MSYRYHINSNINSNIKSSEQEFCGALERYVVAELAANLGKCSCGHAKQSIPEALSSSVFAIKLE